MPKIDPRKAKETFEKYLKEIDNLKGVPPKDGGTNLRDELDEKIRTLINLSFDDSGEKLKRYNKNPYMSITSGMPDEEITKLVQQYHIEKLDRMKQQVNVYIEELGLFLDTSEQANKLSKLQNDIEEKKLEAERRKAVLETKIYGGEIEVITALREELKRRNESTKEISEIKIRLEQIEEKLSQRTLNRTATSEFVEDRLYDELKEATLGDNQKETLDRVASARKILAEIKGLRMEIPTLQKQHELIDSLFDKRVLSTKIENKAERMTNLLKDLAGIHGSLVRPT